MVDLNSLDLEVQDKKIFKIRLEYLLLLVIFNSRPAILGQLYGEIYYGCSIIIIFLILFIKLKVKFFREILIVYLLFLFFYFYLLVQSFILNLNNIEEVIKTIILMSIGMSGILVFDEKFLIKGIRFLNYIYLFFSVSSMISFFMFLMGREIYLFSISLPMKETFSYSYPVYFPFSLAYGGHVKIFSHIYPRFIANFREPGLLQLIVISLFWINLYLKVRGRRIFNLSLLILLFLTFSTAGYLSFMLSVVVFFLTKKKLKFSHLFFLSLFIVFFITILFFTETQLSLVSKFQNQSGIIRLRAVLASLDLLKENFLFGIGFHKDYLELDIGVNFLGSMAQLGMIGTLFILLPIGFMLYVIFKYNIKYLVLAIPLILTLFFSQPLYDKAIFLFLLTFIIFLSIYETPQNINHYAFLQSR